MDDFVKKIFVACDKDQDGYLDRSDLEEVRRQIGLEGDISEILDQFGASKTGKISYQQFKENSALLFGDLNQSSSDSSPYYSTDSENQLPLQMADKPKNKKDDKKDATSKSKFYLKEDTTLDSELAASHKKIKQLSAAWDSKHPHRKSGGGIEDYLDTATLQHLEKLKIINPPSEGFGSAPSSKASASHYLQMPADMQNMENNREAPDYLEISKKLHLAALTSYKNEIYDLNSRLQQVRQERDLLRKEQTQWIYEKQKLQKEFEEKLQSQTMRITELQSVIAELTRKLNKANGNTIIEEEEEDEEEEEEEDVDDDVRSGSTSDLEVQGSHACSECSCDNCDHRLDDEGPNQVNFLATAHETLGNDLAGVTHQNNDKPGQNKPKVDLTKELHRVLGALESTIEDRRNKGDISDHTDPSISNGLVPASRTNGQSDQIAVSEAKINELTSQLESLKRDKRSLEKQLHDVSVQGYVYQKGNTAHVEEEFSKLRQENNYLRSKLRKSEQEVEDLKALNITSREEKDRLKKKNRALQESLEGRLREPSPIPSTGSAGSGQGHRRSHSTHLDRSESPLSIQRSTSAVSDGRNPQNFPFHPPQRSASFDNRSPVLPRGSPTLHQRSASDARKSSFPSPSHSTQSLHSHQTSAFVQVNSKGYTISPDSSLRRGQHVESSDLGSSIGDDTSQRSDLSRAIVRNLHGRIPETLLQTLLTYHSYDQVLRTLAHHFLSEVEEKHKEGLINVERLESRMAHLQSQNDLLQYSLDESKQNAERLSYLCGKHESNSTAWSLALQNTEHLIETYEVMLQLQESEADIYAANCQVVGIVGNFDTLKSLTSTKSSQSNISIASSSSQQMGLVEDDELMKTFQSKRRDAETQAKSLLHKLDKKYENMVTQLGEDDLKNDDLSLSYKSRTSTGSSQNSACTDTLSKDEETRLRRYIKQLKKERNVCKGTVVELESVHEYSDRPNEEGANERQHELNMDIETAVILQEMQALKEERAELKHRIYLLEKEKRALELKMNSREAQEQAYIVHIEHLKSEVKEQMRKRKLLLRENNRKGLPSEDETLSIASGSTQSNPASSEQHYSSMEEIPADLVQASKRERNLKHRIQELVDTLEKLSKNSEIRHKQTAEYISDLKRANGALVTAYEKAKKRHASRLKKFEQQLVQMAEKYQTQVRALKEQIAILKETPPNTQLQQTETSL